MLEIHETRTITPVQSEHQPEETTMNNQTNTQAQATQTAQNQNPNTGATLNEQTFTYVKGAKPWYKSKTLWLNGAVTALGVASTVMPALRPFVNPRTFGMITTGIGMANTVLRVLTHKPIKGGKGSVQEVKSHE